MINNLKTEQIAREDPDDDRHLFFVSSSLRIGPADRLRIQLTHFETLTVHHKAYKI